MKELDTFCPGSRKDWRQWLEEHHRTEQSVWLVFYKAKTGRASLSWSEAVDEALCFGWIDSTRRPGDGETFLQFFGRRNARSVWSKINKTKVQQLLATGLMTEAGLESIEIAKENGYWTLLDEVEERVVPQDLAQALAEQAGASAYFECLSKSTQKRLLHWLVMAKRPETRQQRIREIADLASQRLLPRQFR